jgi:hypothetical protein
MLAASFALLVRAPLVVHLPLSMAICELRVIVLPRE